VGHLVTHCIVAGGPLTLTWRKLLAGGVKLEWQSRENPPGGRGKVNNSKTKYTCLQCGLNAWPKPAAHLVCCKCQLRLTSADEALPAPGEEEN